MPTPIRDVMPAPLPRPRGPISARVLTALGSGLPLAQDPRADHALRRLRDSDEPWSEGDLQLALWVLYELHFRGFAAVDDRREWDVDLLSYRLALEAVFEPALRRLTDDAVRDAESAADDVVEQIRALIDADDGPDTARFMQREATVDQLRALLVQKSIYTLKESDPSSFVLPRIDGPAKVALAELQYDEYGGGRPTRLHAHLFARAMGAAGLDPTYGAYVDDASAETLAINNAMSLFSLHRRLRGASLGHLATFEATSTMPCRRIAGGVRRLELDDAVWEYFDEHVEADAVHEEVALRNICARLVADEPELHRDVLFGAATCLALDAAAGTSFLASCHAGAGVPGTERMPA
jgi:pyrroloquinoline quinone (PQQ) biosynthesis protein C